MGTEQPEVIVAEASRMQWTGTAESDTAMREWCGTVPFQGVQARVWYGPAETYGAGAMIFGGTPGDWTSVPVGAWVEWNGTKHILTTPAPPSLNVTMLGRTPGG